jgi:aerobic carbon-monoxide dehydrogenase large subunit
VSDVEAGAVRTGRPLGKPWVGRPLLRREDGPLLRGSAVFVGDRSPPDLCHLVMVRSPFSHARLLDVDTGAAVDSPDVVGVLTARDLEGLHPMPVSALEGEHVTRASIPLLADGAVRFAGEPVAAVLANTRAAAEDAAELVQADYDPLPPVADLDEALRDDVLVHPDAGTNVLVTWHRSAGDVDAAFTGADRVVRGRFEIPRIAAAPIETRGALGAYDAGADLLTMWLSAQDPHRPLSDLSEVLGRDPSRIRIVVGDVGGAFGSKGALAPEAAVVAVAAMRLGRPVRWIEDRSENFLAAYQGRGQRVEAELAVGADGRFLALRARVLADLGAYLYPATPIVPVSTAMLLTGVYDIASADVELRGVATTRVPTGPCRGAGRPEAAFVAERMADLAAAELGLDPAEIRRRNVIPPDRFPYRTALGFTYDSGNYRRALDIACERIGDQRLRTEQREARRAGRIVGLGLAVFLERAGSGQWESGAASIEPDGRIVIHTGSTSHGQGHGTTFAQIAADVLGVHPDAVEVRAGDTAEVPEGVGSFGSRSVTIGGSAVWQAVTEVAAKARRVAARMLETDPDLVRCDGGRLVVPDGRSVSLADASAAAEDPSLVAPGEEPGLRIALRFSIAGPVFPFGAYAVAVEIDPGTGRLTVGRIVAVDDAGRIVNQALAEGQVLGSTIQGLGEAVSEEAIFDENGQVVTGTFATYGILAAPDVPPVESLFVETPSPLNPLGAKGVGESGAIAMPAAVANAVADALAPFGVRHLDPPYTPERLWRAIQSSAARA